MVINDSDCQRVYMRNAAAEFNFLRLIHDLGGMAPWPPFHPPLNKRSEGAWGPGQSIFGIFEAHRTAHKKLNFS